MDDELSVWLGLCLPESRRGDDSGSGPCQMKMVLIHQEYEVFVNAIHPYFQPTAVDPVVQRYWSDQGDCPKGIDPFLDYPFFNPV